MSIFISSTQYEFSHIYRRAAIPAATMPRRPPAALTLLAPLVEDDELVALELLPEEVPEAKPEAAEVAIVVVAVPVAEVDVAEVAWVLLVEP